MDERTRNLARHAVFYAFLFVVWFFVGLSWDHHGWVRAALGALVDTAFVGTVMTISELMRARRRRRLDRGPVSIRSRATADGPGRGD